MTTRIARNVALEMALQQRAMGRRIAQMRERAHLTQEAAADRAGVTLRAYQKWEAGGGIQYANLQRLAEALKADIEEITGEAESPSPFRVRDQISDVRDEFREDVDEIKAQLAELVADRETLHAEIERQNTLLARQSRLLERIEGLVQVLEGAQMDVSAPTAGGAREPLPDPEELVGPRAPRRTPRTTADPDDPREGQRRKPA